VAARYRLPASGDWLPDLNAELTRLLQNQADIGNAIKPVYGDAAGDQLTALLREHILVAGEILQDVKTGDTRRSRTRSSAGMPTRTTSPSS
jgi:hypothetical protein